MQHYSQINDKSWKQFLLKAIFRPLFKLLFINHSKSFTFVFKTTKINNCSIVTNLKEFIMCCPLFILNSNSEIFKESCWNIQENSTSNDVEVQLLIHQNNDNKDNHKNEKKSSILKSDGKIEDINAIQFYNNEIIQIFEYMNNQHHFELINNNEENIYKVLLFKLKRNEIKRRLKYPSELPNILLNTVNYNQNLNDIINEINGILFKPPYSILYGRINASKFNENISHQNSKIQNVDKSFYEGFLE